jgi:glutaredoxin
MLTVTLYTKDGCGLCDEVKAKLAELAKVSPHDLREVDITKDADLFARYRFSIPVVKIGEQTLKAPITRNQLQSALQIASLQ